MDDERELIQAVLSGHTDRYRYLVERYGAPIVRFISNLCGDAHDAEDIAQDVFLTAYNKLDSWSVQRGRFATWLFAIARNQTLNSIRRHRLAASTVNCDIEDSRGSGEPEGRELRIQLDSAFSELPQDQRVAFLLSEVEGLSYAEIAQVERVPVGTIKSRIHRARERLQNLLNHVREDL
jgi:RNA polymerase sigma-70 factor, ECF subfamily